MATMRAIVFINWSMPLGLGHVGWGFECAKGIFYFGAVELTNSIVKGRGEWTALFNQKDTVQNMIRRMRTGDHGGSGFIYHAYKSVNVSHPNQTAPLKIIAEARARGLKTMIGCMSESSIAIAAGASIGALFDHIDLDSHLNLNPDPADGAPIIDGVITPTDRPGHGGRRGGNLSYFGRRGQG